MRALLVAPLIFALLQSCKASPILSGWFSTDDNSHIQNPESSRQTEGQEQEEHLATQLLSEFSILTAEFFLQIIGFSVGAFNILRQVIASGLETLQGGPASILQS